MLLLPKGANYWGSGLAAIQLIERARLRGVNVWADQYSYNTTGSDGNTLCIAGLGGLPQASLPLAELDGLPLGLSLVGPRGSDLQLLKLARDLLG